MKREHVDCFFFSKKYHSSLLVLTILFHCFSTDLNHMVQSCAFGRHCIDILIVLFDRHCIDVLIVLCFETHFQAKLPMSEIAATINEFRTRHLSELTEVSSFQFVFFLLDWVSGNSTCGNLLAGA